MVGLAENKATQPSLAGAWAELGNMFRRSSETEFWSIMAFYVTFSDKTTFTNKIMSNADCANDHSAIFFQVL